MLFSMPRAIIAINIEEDIYCQDRFHGVNDPSLKMVYEKHALGKFCVLYDFKTLEKIKVIPYNFTDAQRYCEVPGFFQLNKWSNRCQ